MPINFVQYFKLIGSVASKVLLRFECTNCEKRKDYDEEEIRGLVDYIDIRSIFM